MDATVGLLLLVVGVPLLGVWCLKKIADQRNAEFDSTLD